MFSGASYLERVQTQVPLRQLTTLAVGGPVDWLVRVKNVAELQDVVMRARQHEAPILPLGEGSNIIVSDVGVRGVAVIVDFKQISQVNHAEHVVINVDAGVMWDDLVQYAVSNNLAGVEAMSGVPGTVGAAPVQNIGCYGQELSSVLVSLTALDTHTNQIKTFQNEDCRFSYRHSIFKDDLTHRYIILKTELKLSKKLLNIPRYPDIDTYLLNHKIVAPTVLDIRNAVLAVRRQKSMVLDENDPNTKSVGSFFTNPVIDEWQLQKLLHNYYNLPHWKLGDNEYKIPAAWLVERAGFTKGYHSNHVGISSNHSLAIINLGDATAAEVLELGEQISSTVKKVFGIELQREPQIIS